MVLDGSLKTSDMIVKISEFLNSLFYEAKTELIPLNVELELMERNFWISRELAFGEKVKDKFCGKWKYKLQISASVINIPFSVQRF